MFAFDPVSFLEVALVALFGQGMASRYHWVQRPDLSPATSKMTSRISHIERGKLSRYDVLARYTTALGGRLHQAIYFDDGDITAIA